MILGVDHLAISSVNLAENLGEIQKSGYHVKFVHNDLPNSITKKPFLSSYQSSHSAAYCRADHGISLELIEYGTPLEDTLSWYQVLLDGPPADREPFTGSLPCTPEIWKKTVGCDGAQPARWRPFRAQFWYGAGQAGGVNPRECNRGTTVRAVLVPVTDFKRSLLFWTDGLRAHEVKHGIENGHSWIHLSWPAPVSRWSLEIILFETADGPGFSYLDRSGFPCLAFLSNELLQDCLRLTQCGALKISEPSDHVINDKPLKISFVRGPSLEMVELIEIKQSPVAKRTGGTR